MSRGVWLSGCLVVESRRSSDAQNRGGGSSTTARETMFRSGYVPQCTQYLLTYIYTYI